MEFFLIKALAFLRPVLSIDTGVRLSGLNLFELAAMIFSGMIFAAFAVRTATFKNLNLSSTDLVIGGFVFWCIAIHFIYFEKSQMSVLAKFIVPPLTYVIAKSVIPDREEYRKMLRLLILGFSIPLFASLGLILLGNGLEEISYWTGAPRYKGAYSGAHEMGHNAAFSLMVVWLYLLLQRDNQVSISTVSKTILGLLVATAVFLLYMGRVRTTVVGLFVFGSVLLALHYRRLSLILVATVVIGLSFILSDEVQKRFFPEGVRAEKAAGFDNIMSYGSNRPAIWSRQMSEFLNLPIDHQLAGIGIGNTFAGQTGRPDNILHLDTHNDFLRVMVHTGVVGLVLFLALQVLILKRILRLSGGGKWAFLALFAAVTMMNLLSNSYVNRFGLAQMFYLVLTYIELPQRRVEAYKRDKHKAELRGGLKGTVTRATISITNGR